MNKSKCSQTLTTLFAICAGTLLATAAESITITNPSAENWYAQRSNANVGAPSIGDTGTVTFSSMDSSSYAWTYFSPTTLAVGENISVSGTMIFNSIYAGTENKAPGNFIFGLFSSNTNSQSFLNSTLGSAESDNGINANGKATTLGMKVLTGGMTGFFTDATTAYAWKSQHSSYGFMATNGSSATQTNTTLSPAGATESASEAYNFSLQISKTAEAEYSLTIQTQTGSADAITSTTSFSEIDSISKFDVFGIKAPVSTGTTGTSPNGTLTLSNFVITTTGTVIPEPSLFGVLAGLFALAFAGTRRRKNNFCCKNSE